MHPIIRTSALFAILLASAACSNDVSIATPAPSNPNQGIVAGTLEVKAANATVTLRNTTEFAVGYMVVDKDQMVIALYPPCGTQCPTIVQGAQASINYADISGYTSASIEAIVLWWTYTRAADGTLRPTSGVYSTRVTL